MFSVFVWCCWSRYGVYLGICFSRQPTSPDQETRICCVGDPKPCLPGENTTTIHHTLPCLSSFIEAQSPNPASWAPGPGLPQGPQSPRSPGGTEGNPLHTGVPQPATPPGTQVEAPLGLAITSSLILLAPLLLAVELLVYHSEGREKVAEEKEKEGEAAHEHLQGLGKRGQDR